MKILVTNNTLGDMPGGSEWHAYELCLALKRLGHVVYAYTPSPGWFYNQLIVNDVVCSTKPPEEKFDLILASHTSTIDLIDRSKTEGRMIQICHGVYPKLEQPSGKVDFHVAISDEVKSHLENVGYDCEVIHNGVDHSKFKAVSNGHGVLSMCQGSLANKMIEESCKKIGVQFQSFNKFNRYSYNLDEVIPIFDVVVSLGRGAYEAMACNKKVVILDSRHYINSNVCIGDGIVTSDNACSLLTHNMSGRALSIEYNQDGVDNLIEEALQSDNQNLRRFSEEHMNIDIQAKKYCDLKDGTGVQRRA
jgi:hypothetical protein